MLPSVLSNTHWSISPDNCVAWSAWLLKEAAGLLGKNQVQLYACVIGFVLQAITRELFKMHMFVDKLGLGIANVHE